MRQRSLQRPAEHGLEIQEVRLVGDLRIMHAKVDELHQIVENLKRRYNEEVIFEYADFPVLSENIRKVDEIYLWFVRLKDETARKRRTGSR